MTNKDNTPTERESLNELRYSVAAIRKIVVIQFIIQLIGFLAIWSMSR